MFDYECLRVLWWAILGFLLMGFAVMDGFDIGSLSLLLFVARNDNERRIVINTIGPVWEGNQVWLILGAGSIFAAWPMLYAVAFSGFYLAIFVALYSLILRPVGIKFRSKMPDKRWRDIWDRCLFISGTVPPIIFGVAFGNALQGVPFTFDDSMRMTYSGSFFGLLNPFALLCGVLSLVLFWLQGATWLLVKTDEDVQWRARQVVAVCSVAALLLFAIGGLWVGFGVDGYRFTSAIDPHGPSNPLFKTVTRATGAWMGNYKNMPVSIFVPLLAVIGAALALWGAVRWRVMTSFIGSSLMFISVICTAGISMFPFLLPSSANPDASLTVWDASSSRATLITMTLVTAVIMPFVLAYTAWVYHVLRGKVKAVDIKQGGESLY